MIKLFHCADCNFVVEDFSGKKTLDQILKEFPNHQFQEHGTVDVDKHRYKASEDGKGKFKMEIRDATVEKLQEAQQAEREFKIREEMKQMAVDNLKKKGVI